uniref:Follistatin-related protein 5 n=1 Tax=Strigamia maritima TaxID=126957 RepID=T1IVU0_STRMM
MEFHPGLHGLKLYLTGCALIGITGWYFIGITDLIGLISHELLMIQLGFHKKLRVWVFDKFSKLHSNGYSANSDNDSDKSHELSASSRQDKLLSSWSSEPAKTGDKRHKCTVQEYEILKDNLLLYNHAKLMDMDDKNRGGDGKEYLVSIMFSHYDQNNDGILEEEELITVAESEYLNKLSNACRLADIVVFDDTDHDGRISLNEFYVAFSVSVVSLDKALEVNHVSARVGDNVEIKCDVTGTPLPPIVWRRNDVDLSTLAEEEIKVFMDGSLYLTRVQLIHAGNYTCHAQRNKDVVQTHVLHVETLPQVHVIPKIQSKHPGDEAVMQCHASGVPTPRVQWLKNDEELKLEMHKYNVIGNSTALSVNKLTYSDTGAYMCVATNTAGSVRDISSLVVQDEPTPSMSRLTGTATEEKRFFVFHDWGVSVYEPISCRLYHQIQSTDIIPGTQEYVCGDKGVNCSWGRAISVADRYVYVSQPSKDLWVLCWRSLQEVGAKTIQIIRDASQKKKHHSVHAEPIDGHFDLVRDLFVPTVQDTGHKFKYGYAVHSNQRGMYKVDLAAMKYVHTIDLSAYNCVPESMQFASIGGFVVIECGGGNGQLLMDLLTDSVLGHKPLLLGSPTISPDSRYIVTIDRRNTSVTIITQEISEYGVTFSFDVKTTLNLSDFTFYPSKTTHSYDIYATSVDKEDILFVNLADGKVEMITGVGKALPPPLTHWHNVNRPISSSGLFGNYMVTPAIDALFVVNGQTRTVNCEIGSIMHPRLVVWVTAAL